ncbi:MAG: Hsp70 family protein [Akkermansia sp.]|nr:Hsp70 family protein [Akkermansia sp.]
MQDISIGIYFGTTKAMVAWVNPKTSLPETVWLGGEHSSTVYVGENGEFFFGEAAEKAAAQHPERYCCDFKDKLGSSQPALMVYKDGKFCTYSARQLTAAFLRHIRERCEREVLIQAVDSAVITRPVEFSPAQVEDLRLAAEEAGFREVTFIVEQEAAVLGAALWHTAFAEYSRQREAEQLRDLIERDQVDDEDKSNLNDRVFRRLFAENDWDYPVYPMGTFGIIEKMIQWLGENLGRTKDEVVKRNSRDIFLLDCREIDKQLNVLRKRFDKAGLLERLVAFMTAHKDWGENAQEELNLIQQGDILYKGRDKIESLARRNEKINTQLHRPETNGSEIKSTCEEAFNEDWNDLRRAYETLFRLYKKFEKGMNVRTDRRIKTFQAKKPNK